MALLRRLILAFLLSIVIGLFASSISKADGFQAGQLDVQVSSPTALIWHYDAPFTLPTRSVGVTVAGISAGRVSNSEMRMSWANTPSGAEFVAADSSLPLSTADSWGNPATLADHFARHGADFGATSADEYAGQASQFFQRSQAAGLPTKIDSSGVIRVYDPATNEFGAFNPDGTTRTYFAPNAPNNGYATNWDYWQAQPGNAP